MFDFNDEVYKAIRGTYEPTQLFTTVICNYDNTDKLDPRDTIVLFHEKFHHWQFIMTNYGQLKWASYRTVSSEVLYYWTSYLEQTHDKGKMPISYMLQEGDLLVISAVANIYLRKQMINMLNLKE